MLMLVWLLVATGSCAAPVIAAARRGIRAMCVALTAPLGAIMCFGFVSATIGIVEGPWTLDSLAFWLAVALGLAGVVLIWVGWRAALRPRFARAACQQCGHQLLPGAALCTECGHLV
jgi:hypothetical protein